MSVLIENKSGLCKFEKLCSSMINSNSERFYFLIIYSHFAVLVRAQCNATIKIPGSKVTSMSKSRSADSVEIEMLALVTV